MLVVLHAQLHKIVVFLYENLNYLLDLFKKRFAILSCSMNCNTLQRNIFGRQRVLQPFDPWGAISGFEALKALAPLVEASVPEEVSRGLLAQWPASGCQGGA
ncbi:MAG: hypothetical protein R6U22_11055 [Desulfohalobiaceae bacterium]